MTRQSSESSSSRSTSATGAVSAQSNQSLELESPPDGRGDWSHLPSDFQRHLEYFVANITSYHYSIANDGDDFFAVILPNIAVRHEPLLHAVVGFSAYHAMLQDPDGQLQDFKYYNGGVTLLLEQLKRKETNVATLLTILQLATMEVSLELVFTSADRSFWATGSISWVTKRRPLRS